MAKNRGDPDPMPYSVASDLALHCLPITLLRASILQWVKSRFRERYQNSQFTHGHINLSKIFFFRMLPAAIVISSCLFVLRFYGPVNPMESCPVPSVYLSRLLLGRLSPLSG